MPEPAKRPHGCVIAVLVVVAIISVPLMLLAFAAPDPKDPDVSTYRGIFGALNLFCVVMIWRGQRWFAFGIAGTYALSLAIAPAAGPGEIAGAISVPAALFLALLIQSRSSNPTPVEGTWVCSCGGENRNRARHCKTCGMRRGHAGQTCHACGAEQEQDARFCDDCGAALRRAAKTRRG